ncbi:metallophosphoesterase family protein [Paraliomyxa miuraensis]|uniref:metallophosphoesterase family protein n=1 Tax=Paraliomyxa miuraensis TaxID=376150 RepID=UPI00224EE135|nr:metallophosphoesterase family protein [Paraliomyxa miuraensis]MCX4246138.1 serine/threonine protein phosphatase [Paraliomyxa miuraensis]
MIQLSPDPAIAEQQIEAVIFYLTTCGYIDSEFDLREKAFVRSFLRRLVTARVDAQGALEPEVRFEQIEHQHEHYVERFQQIDYDVRSLFTEAVAEGEDPQGFVLSQLKLRCYEMFRELSPENRGALLETVDEFINADGVVHPAEVQFRNDLAALLGAEVVGDDVEIIEIARLEVSRPTELPSRQVDHPFFSGFEHHYSADPEQIRKQIEADIRQLEQVEARWEDQRKLGRGRLRGKQAIDDFTEPGEFLDGHVHVVSRPRDFELTVLGDLHGCYSCLKAAVMQSDFMNKVRAYRADPDKHPEPRLVLLGDYIDRGRFSFNGVLRAVLKLYLTVPEHVFVLRGNHEYYIEYQGRIYGGVKPADTINSLSTVLPTEVFERYLAFFERMPNSLLYDDLMFVHGGIPRDSLLRERWKDLSSLNDPDIRFQMLWSDPSRADVIPDDLQSSSARFPFGRQQFRRFMSKLGCVLMVRGHEKVNAGFKDMYPRDDIRLLTLFSAGGVENDDVPEDSNYRDVRPMALTIARKDGETTVTPWAIDYRSYQRPELNRFFASDPSLASS